jgi:uncharacterized protein (UPF0333 family)
MYFSLLWGAVLIAISLMMWYVVGQHERESDRALVNAEKRRLRAIEQAKAELEAEKQQRR